MERITATAVRHPIAATVRQHSPSLRNPRIRSTDDWRILFPAFRALQHFKDQKRHTGEGEPDCELILDQIIEIIGKYHVNIACVCKVGNIEVL
ncbi:hypothetical protein L1987_77753 [Smallanthus sonchifolius]|uniref:Uncharacterized protein n=1 Tax=Smallanthus sonchifolius TaxID=185202 RepID=A0ACB8ZBR5_9ASTR|nr:hypothetical protein L1987_77753 [Smallanthus sonchifolius]